MGDDMRNYDNEVQKIKSEVLKLVSKYAFEGTLDLNRGLIPFEISPGPNERIRCCIYHERAVTAERVALAIGESDTLIKVLDTACDQCPINRYIITEACRGCLGKRCSITCPVNAITTTGNKAVVDYSKCIECGKCKDACPYHAIADVMRPCRRECPTGAIQIDERKKAVINHEDCIDCGSCVYHCPFGAIQDKSEIIPVIAALKEKNSSVYAVIAPAFSSQFDYVDLKKVIAGISALGFRDVIEAALGADLVVQEEARELQETMKKNQVLTSSCCPSFVSYIEKKYDGLIKNISTTVSPMIATARLIRSVDPSAMVVFIGPCIAKKREKDKTKEVDYVLTFEELAAMLDALDIDLDVIEERTMNNASYFGRRFAATGGLTLAVEHYFSDKEESPSIITCDGIKECDQSLKKLKVNKLSADFIEGMSCKGGCVKGPVTMHHGPKDLKAIEKYAKLALEATPEDATSVFAHHKVSLHK
jgi:[FeFe] hydrogenase (group B1/B3)